MAFLRQLSNSRYWIAQFDVLTPEGKWRAVTRSTKIEIIPRDGSSPKAAREDALKIAEAWEYAAKRGMTERQVRRVMIDLARKVSGMEIEVPTVKDWFEQRIKAYAKEGLRPASIRNYTDARKKFFICLGTKVDWALDKIDSADIEAFKLYLLDRVAISTTNETLGLVKRVFGDAVRLIGLDGNPCNAVQPAKRANAEKERHAKRAFTLEELTLVLEHADEEMKSMVLVSLYTGGQRLGDVACMGWEQVDFEKGVVVLRTMKTGRGLGVPMVPPLRRWLEARRKAVPGDWVHPACKVSYDRRGSSLVSRDFMAVLYKAGLIALDPMRAGKKSRGDGDVSMKRVRNELSFHSLRYTATTMLHEAGVPFALVQEIVGHDSKDVHEGYISKFGERAVMEALEKLPDLA